MAMNIKRITRRAGEWTGVVWLACTCLPTCAEPRVPLWQAGKPNCALVLPAKDGPASRLAHTTVNRYLQEFYGIGLPAAAKVPSRGACIVLGTPENNPALARLVKRGLKLGGEDLGDEGFRLLTCEDGKAKCVVVYGKTPRALKHGCQELIFYHLAATAEGGWVDWPLGRDDEAPAGLPRHLHAALLVAARFARLLEAGAAVQLRADAKPQLVLAGRIPRGRPQGRLAHQRQAQRLRQDALWRAKRTCRA